jgi:MFS family permease
MNNQWTTNLRLLWGGQFLSVLSSMVIAPMLPFYMEQLGAEDEAAVLMWSGLSLAAPAISAALTAPLWGRLGDRSSRKWMVVRALLGSALILAVMGLAETPFQLFVLRFFQGALGGVVDAGAAFAASEARQQEQGQVRGKLDGALAAGSMLGPLLGGISFGAIGFRNLFLVLSALLGVWAVLSFIYLKESPKETVLKRTAALPSAGMTKQLFNLLSERKASVFLLAGICANFGIFGLLTVLPLHVRQHIAEPAHTAVWVGILQAVNWASVWLTSSWWGKRNDTYPVERNFVIAAAVCGISIILQAFTPSAAWLIPLRAVQGFASSALLQSVFLIVTRLSSGGQLGSRIGFSRSILFTGQIVGPLACGFLGTIFSSPAIFALNGVVIVTGGLLVWLFAEPNNSPRLIHETKG